MLDPILFWGPVIVGCVWSVLALHNLFYLLDADNSTPAFRVLFNRALVSAALLPIFWFVLLHTTRKLPAGWPVLAVEGALLLMSSRGIYTQLLLRTKSRAIAQPVSEGARRLFWLLLLLGAALSSDLLYLAGFATRYSPGVDPASRRAAWLLAFVFAWVVAGWVSRCWRFRRDIRKTVPQNPSMGARLIMGLLGLVIASLGLALMSFNHLGLQTEPLSLVWSWGWLGMLVITGLGAKMRVNEDLRRIVGAAQWIHSS